MRVGVLPCSLAHCGAPWLVASRLAIASLPLVSRPWTVLSWSHLMSLGSVGDRLLVVPRQLIGSTASTILPSFSSYEAAFLQVLCFDFAMRSPFRVESVSVLDRNEGSSYSFLVFGGSLRDEVTLTVRVFLRPRSERRLFAHLP